MAVFTLPCCLAHHLTWLSMERGLLQWAGCGESHVGSCCATTHHCPPQALVAMAPGLLQHWSLLISPISRRFPYLQEPNLQSGAPASSFWNQISFWGTLVLGTSSSFQAPESHTLSSLIVHVQKYNMWWSMIHWLANAYSNQGIWSCIKKRVQISKVTKWKSQQKCDMMFLGIPFL